MDQQPQKKGVCSLVWEGASNPVPGQGTLG
jgi:hypothetical protein